MPSVARNGLAPGPVYSQRLPLLTRIRFFLTIWAFKAVVVVGLRVLRLVMRSTFKTTAPTYTKRYPVRPMLECRVFIPKSHASGQRLPLMMNIHGGAYCIGDPATDDHVCHHFADRFGYCVVSLDYRKAPGHPFPTPLQDCVALARAVLADPDLPVDHAKVVLAGTSAGGNLSFGVAQNKDLRDKIKAIVAFVPSVDFTGQYPREYRITKEGKHDLLKGHLGLVKWAYVPLGVDLRITTLSPILATRSALPQKIYFIGAEYDCLCKEASMMARKLAGVDDNSKLGSKWEKHGIRWETIPDQQHGFTHMQAKGEKEAERKRICTALYQRVDEWLRREVF